jgi:hypothetical protein
MENYTFPYKKVLILENEWWNENDSSGFHYFYKSVKEDGGVEFKIIDNAAGKDRNEIVQALLWADVLMFESTFLYESDVKGLGDLLMKIPVSKHVIGYPVSNKSLQQHIEQIWEVEELAKMSHHKVFELVETHPSLMDEEPPLLEIDMVQYKTIWDKQEKERIEKNHSIPKTGRKVRIGKLQAFGEQWSLLKEGDVVDELDCTSIDPNNKRGVWVMGKDEPVKLLNDDNYEEFQFETITAEALTIEFFSRGRSKDRKDLMETVEIWIARVSAKCDGSELWDWCDSLCNLIGVERRGNRSYFEKRLKEYQSKYQYFGEGDPRLKKVSAFK